MSAPTSLSYRASERVRARRRSRLRVALLGLVLAGVVVAAGWVVLGSSVLGVAQVRVTGVARLGADEVRDAAAVPSGTPLARLDTAAVAARVSGLPVVRSVAVVRRWPRAVEISVRERTAVAARPVGSAWQLVDRSGVAFAVEARRPKGLPIVTAPPDAGRRDLRAGLDAVRALPAPVREQVREVRASDADHVTLRLSKGRTVVWGSAERAERKASVLAVLLSRRASVYDVSAPDIPTTRR